MSACCTDLNAFPGGDAAYARVPPPSRRLPSGATLPRATVESAPEGAIHGDGREGAGTWTRRLRERIDAYRSGRRDRRHLSRLGAEGLRDLGLDESDRVRLLGTRAAADAATALHILSLARSRRA